MSKVSKELQKSRVSGAPVIDIVHRRVHLGEMFSADRLDPALADQAMIQVLLKVQSSQAAHARIGVAIGGDGYLYVYENPTISANGTPLTPLNRNRILADSRPATTLVYYAPTITGTGTELGVRFLPGGNVVWFSTGVRSGFEQEWVFKPGNNYLIRLKNVSGLVNPANIHVDFYEPDPLEVV